MKKYIPLWFILMTPKERISAIVISIGFLVLCFVVMVYPIRGYSNPKTIDGVVKRVAIGFSNGGSTRSLQGPYAEITLPDNQIATFEIPTITYVKIGDTVKIEYDLGRSVAYPEGARLIEVLKRSPHIDSHYPNLAQE